MSAILELQQVTKRFGGLVAVNDVSFQVQEGEILGILGPNGAGKTTLYNCVSGYLHPEEGSIRFDGKELSRMRPEFACKLGVARTWQIVRIFKRMTVLDNVMCGAFNHTNSATKARKLALELLEFTGLAGKENFPAINLTLAEKKRLELTRALASQPKVLLLDETMSGLNPTEQQQAVELVRRIRDEFKMTTCVVEHVMEVVMPLSHRVVVLDYGVKIAEGTPGEVSRDEKVIKAYLGEKYRARSS